MQKHLNKTCQSKQTKQKEVESTRTAAKDGKSEESNNSQIYELRKQEELEGSEKSRHKRQLRRMLKGLPVHKGVLRDPPKLIEQRLEEGLVLKRKNEMTFTLAGAENSLEIELVYIGSDRDLETQHESHGVYKKYQVSIHNDDPNDVTKKQWKRFLLDNPFREKGEAGGHHSGLPLGLYHCQYRLSGEFISYL